MKRSNEIMLSLIGAVIGAILFIVVACGLGAITESSAEIGSGICAITITVYAIFTYGGLKSYWYLYLILLAIGIGLIAYATS